MSRLALLALPAMVACVPVLTTPEGAEGVVSTGLDWEAPENTWDAADFLPADLAPEGFREGETIPDVRLVDQNGDTVSLWQFYGQVIAIDVSTMWCGPCQGLAKEVDEVWETYHDDGFMYVTLLPENRSGQTPTVEDLVSWGDTHGITAPILSDDWGYAYEIEPNQAWPRVVVVGRDLKVRVNPVVPAEDAAIRDAVEAALAD